MLKAEKKLNNAVVYARYSSHGQQEQSIEGQLRDCYAYAKREGLIVVGEYIDRAISAKTDARPDFRRMISDASKKQFQYIIVWKLDRFARNRFDSAVHKAALKKHGVKVVSAMENIADNPEGALLEGILESMAEHYSASLSENVKRGQRESIRKGSHLGSKPPYGFKSVKDGDKMRLVADDEKAPIIKYVFEQYASGVPKKKIMEELNFRGISNYNGKPFTITSMQNALRNTKYVGRYMFNGEVIEGACDAIVSEDLFNAVQERLDAVRHAPAAQKARKEYLLQNKAYCGHCGVRLVGDSGTSKSGKVHNYYACGNRKKHHTCDKQNEKKNFLEWYVVEQTVKYVLTPSNIDLIAKGIVADYDNEFNATRIKGLERQVIKIDTEVNKLVDLLVELPKKTALKTADKIELLETQKADIELNLVTLRIASEHKFTTEQITAWLKSFCAGDELDEEYQRRIISVFINAIFLYDNKLVIYYNGIKGGKQVSYINMCDEVEGLTLPDNDSPANYGEHNNLNPDGVRISHSTPHQMTPYDNSQKPELSYVFLRKLRR
ncbi:MAG: recombinase family protein [Oscillospiraceae bacterium]|nr:recombinase family protein [Oscillospiraceae bacterium]MCL2277928.1 recombinase family protein [Oscillospiraceae bacterium]